MFFNQGVISTENLNPDSGTPTPGGYVSRTLQFGEGVVIVQVTGTYTGALAVQLTADGENWIDVPVVDIETGDRAASIASASEGAWRADVSGAVHVRVSASEAITGSAVVTIRAGTQSSQTDINVTLSDSDIQIGAVEIKDATSANRQAVAADGRAATDANLQIGNTDAPGGAGNVSASTPRMVLANDVALPAGENHIGQVGAAVLNPSASFTRPADTTQYAVGDLVANSTTAGSVTPMQFTAARVAAGSFHISRARLRKSDPGITASAFRLHLFNSSPTVTNGDNGAFVPSGSANYLGALDIAVNRACSDGAVGVGTPVSGNAISVKLASGTIIYGLLEALNTYTPVSGETFAPTLEIFPD